MREALQRAWLRRGTLAWVLLPLAVLYGTLLWIRRLAYRIGLLRKHSVRVPVVVVGNLIVGGAGKTPVVIALVHHLTARGLRPAVVSRGWKGRTTEAGQMAQEVLHTSAAAEVGDEPLLIHRACGVPVFVGKDRPGAAEALLRTHPETDLIVSDDGLQHLALHRDVEICVFDKRLAGNGFLLPAGPLREPASRQVDLTLCDAGHPWPGALAVRRRLGASAVAFDGQRVPLDRLRNTPLIAIAGIAQPEAFFSMLRAADLQLETTQALPDHHDFAAWTPPSGGRKILCTEKDAVKLWPSHPEVLAVPLEIEFDKGFLQAFDRLLDAQLSSRHGSETA